MCLGRGDVNLGSSGFSEHRSLLEQMQALNYGRVLNIPVRDGAPHFTPMTRVEWQVRFGRDNRHRPECGLDDFELKDKVVESWFTIERMDDKLSGLGFP